MEITNTQHVEFHRPVSAQIWWLRHRENKSTRENPHATTPAVQTHSTQSAWRIGSIPVGGSVDSFDDWEPHAVEGEDGRFLFTHTDPPKPNGKTFQVTWDTVFTADFDNPCIEDRYEEGDRYHGFPFESSYEIVTKSNGK